MVQTLKKMLSEQIESFTNDDGMAAEEEATEKCSDYLDMLEQGLVSLYNP